jgi:cytochrome c-type biogenesis protein CcmH/NrfG
VLPSIAVLLDQKKTRRMVVIVSIICAVAFVGVLPVVLGLVVFGGGAQDASGQLIDDAKQRVEENPTSVRALVDLAAQYRAAGEPQDATTTLQRALALGPKTREDLQALIGGLSEQPALQLQVLQTYTKSHPKDGEAFFTYGATAEQLQQVLVARLAYQRAAQVAPKGSTLSQNAQAALTRLRDAPVTPTPTVSTTPTAPATPATP